MATIEEIFVDKNGACLFKIVIQNFTKDTGEIGKSLCTKTIVNQGVKWLFKVYPKGINEHYKDYLSLEMALSPENSRETVVGSWAVLIGVGSLLETASILDDQNDDIEYTKMENVGVRPDSISRDVLFDRKNKLIINNSLCLFSKLESRIARFDLESPGLKTDFSLQLGSRQKVFTDFTINVQDKSIKTHKLYLAESSNFFYQMLCQDEEFDDMELSENLDFETAEKMINFLYEDKVDDLENFAMPLLSAANTYEFNRLKKYCEKYLFDCLDTENVISTLKFACTCSEDLKVECVQFIARQIQEIPNPNWKEIITEFPDTFEDLFRHWVYLKHQSIQFNFTKFTIQNPTIENPALHETDLSHDLEYLFMNPHFADVVFVVEGKTLKAHKSVLFSRSTVFQAMFCNDTFEANESQVNITDFDYETIQELLRFIYCEKVFGLEKNALNLLEAADKYNLMKLVKICEKSVEKSMTVDNVTKIWQVADLHQRSELKEKAIAFFGRNILEVLETAEWKEFIKSNHRLLLEVFVEWIHKFF